MRIFNLSKATEIDRDPSEYEVRKIENYCDPDGLMFDLSDEKTKKSVVKYYESIIRSSIEYKELINFLKEEINMKNCCYFKHVNKVEIHHEPFSLFDITTIILNRFIDEGYPIDTANICEAVMKLHYEGLVGLIPLNKTVHELVHASQVFIPLDYVFGDVGEFFNKYRIYMTEQQKEILSKSIKYTELIKNTPIKVLKKRFVYLEVDGMVMPQRVPTKK